MGWVIVIAAGVYLLWRSRQADGPPAFAEITGPLLEAQFTVPIERAALVPRGLKVYGPTWATLCYGGHVLKDIDDFACANGIRYHARTANQNTDDEENQLRQALAGGGRLRTRLRCTRTTIAGSMLSLAQIGSVDKYSAAFYQISAKGQAAAEGMQSNLYAWLVHGYDVDLTCWPSAVWREGEMRAWFRHADLWRLSGPANNRIVALNAMRLAPSGKMFWEAASDAGALDEGYGQRITSYGFTAVSPFRHFLVPSEENVFLAYVGNCIMLAAWGLLPRPPGVPRIELGADSSSALGSIFGGIGKFAVNNAGLVVSGVLGNAGSFGAAAAKTGLSALAKLAAGEAKYGGKLPWHPDWAPVLVDRKALIDQARRPGRYHTFGDEWRDTQKEPQL